MVSEKIIGGIMNESFGIVYVATGEKYLTECIQSAKSAKKVMPDIPISLWSDKKPGSDSDCFDDVFILANPKYSFFDKIEPLTKTKYEKNLFVDTDTFFMHSVYEISLLLDQFELAYCHAPRRVSPWDKNLKQIPICFPEPNTGVIAYRRNEKVINVFLDWLRIYNEQMDSDDPPVHDQPAFREAIFLSEVHSTVLPPEYNFRTVYPGFKGKGCPVKILHGRSHTLNKAINIVNKPEDYDRIAVYDFRPGIITRIQNKIFEKA